MVKKIQWIDCKCKEYLKLGTTENAIFVPPRSRTTHLEVVLEIDCALAKTTLTLCYGSGEAVYLGDPRAHLSNSSCDIVCISSSTNSSFSIRSAAWIVTIQCNVLFSGRIVKEILPWFS